jgi:ATP-dependent DNA ligase
MLADRGLPRGDLAGWAAEPKLDGWRATVVVDPGLPGGVVVRTRRGHGITSAVPGIGALTEIGHCVVLDGELVAGAGTAGDFYGLLPRPRPDAADLLDACATHDVEGIVLKRLRSIYRPGERTRHWRKLKTPDWSAVHRPRRGPQDPPPE